MINATIGESDIIQKNNGEIEIKQTNKNNRYGEQACLLSNQRIRFALIKDNETRKVYIDLRHLRGNKLTKRGVRLGLDEFKEILGIPRLVELLNFYEKTE